MLKIVGWKENYETHETAKIKKLLWIRQNIACDTLSWAKLTLDPERARSVWLGWTAVTWYVAVTSRNGVIDGTADDVSLLTRVPAEDVSAALTWAQGCGLIVDGEEDETKNYENSAESPSPANLPEISRVAGRISRKSPANLPLISRQSPDTSGDQRENLPPTGQDRTGHVQDTDTDTDSTVQDTDSTLQDKTISSPFFLKISSPLLSSPELTVVNTNTCASAESDSGDDLISANSAGASDGKGEEIINKKGEAAEPDLATRMAEMAASARRLAGIPTDTDDATPREERNILSLIPEDTCERIDRLTGKPSATYCRIIANNEMVSSGIATATRSELEARAAEVAKRLSSEKSTEKALEARQSTKAGEHARKDAKPAPSHVAAPEKGVSADPHPSREEFLAFCREIDPDWTRADEYYTNLSTTGWQLLPRRGETERRPIVNWRRFVTALINNQRGAK